MSVIRDGKRAMNVNMNSSSVDREVYHGGLATYGVLRYRDSSFDDGAILYMSFAVDLFI
jgi:hypothetical protein